jgi:hypothetical protein
MRLVEKVKKNDDTRVKLMGVFYAIMPFSRMMDLPWFDINN